MAEPKAKATLSELDRSNLSNSASQRPTSSSSRYSDASKSENNKHKPQFIVKKVGTEELFKGTGRQNGLAGLSQINEENTADLDDLMPPRFVTNAKEGTKLPVNIFQTEMVSSEKYQEKLKGPSYKDGGIVKHSIVGSTDMFQRYERLQQKMAKENAGSPSKERIKSAKLQHNLSSQDGISISFSERPNTRGNYLGAGSRYSVLAEKKTAKNEVQLSKDEIIDQITKIKERQDISSRDQARATAKRPLSSKLYLTKEERNLNKFENTNNHWQRTVEDLSHKIGREEGSSLMVTSAKFREKRELIQMLDIIQTDEERFGSKLWYHTLRRTKGIANSKGASAALLPQTSAEIFQTTQLQKQITSLEFIRKPILVKTPAEANPPIERPASRLDGNYLETKMIARKHIIREIQPGEVEEMGDLAVKGKNKLKLEAEAILRQANKRESVHVPKRFFNKKEESGQEEVIAKGLAKREISRNGLNVFLN